MIEIVNAARATVPAKRMRAAFVAAAELEEVAARLPDGEWEVAVRVSGDRELHRLNARHLGEDHPTDVLSFPSGAGGLTGGHLGDIVVSWQAVRRQAEQFGHEPEAELLLLLVHGFLHLLGWDHATPAEEAEMARLTTDALARAGVKLAPGRLLESGGAGYP